MVTTGLERLCGDLAERVRGRRVGVLCHHASVTAKLAFAVDALRKAGARVVRLLGPEHGPWGTAQDMVAVASGKDRWTGLDLVSLYGDHEGSLAPDESALAGLDVLVIDLQDVGARYYTYAETAARAVLAAARAGIEALVCDRPNPLGGASIEGNLLRDECTSFVGMHPVPQRHGLSFGELVKSYVEPECAVEVIPMQGWRRDMWFDQTGLPWIPPSPNMPTLTTALVYPGLCLLEGTNVSEGRGTTTPFEVFGAPFVDPFRLARSLSRLDLPGVAFRPHVFQPTFQKYVGQACGGVQIVVTDRDLARPVRLGIAILCTLRSLWPDEVRWRTESYEFVSERPAIDLLLGDPRLRERIDAGASVAEVTEGFAADEATFADLREAWLIHG